MKHILTSMVAILTVTPVLLGPVSAAEDGDVVEQTTVSLTETQRLQILERCPECANFIDSIEVQSITYLSDGLGVKGYVVIPKGDGPFPCLIVNRGGNREYGAISDPAAVGWLGAMANWGYLVIASQYRGVAGGEGVEEFGGADVDDVLNLIPVLESIPKADTSRIGMWGASRGGLMTYLALARTDRVRAAVIAAGMSNSFDTVERRPAMETNVYSELVPNWDTEREVELTARSPVLWADRLNATTPLLLIHGSADWRVHPSQALDMADALLEANHPFRLVVFEGGDHSLSEYREEEKRLTRDFFDRYVRDANPPPDMNPHGK